MSISEFSGSHLTGIERLSRAVTYTAGEVALAIYTDLKHDMHTQIDEDLCEMYILAAAQSIPSIMGQAWLVEAISDVPAFQEAVEQGQLRIEDAEAMAFAYVTSNVRNNLQAIQNRAQQLLEGEAVSSKIQFSENEMVRMGAFIHEPLSYD